MLEKRAKIVFLSIGSNLGSKTKNIELVKFKLEKNNIKIIKSSKNYETLSLPDKKKPKFINIVLKIKTFLSPVDLMKKCLHIEKELGRLRNKKNEPRTCDIDLIDYNGENINIVDQDFNLTTPHFMMTKRSFVLMPIKEIIPNWVHPVYLKKIDHFISLLSEEEKKSIIKID